MAATIVGWDDTNAARAALGWALARSATTPIALIRVVDADVSTVGTSAVDSSAVAARTALVKEAERMRAAHPGLVVTAELISGKPVEVFARFSGEKSLVVVGTDRQRGRGIRYGWSVGAKLAAAAHGPVAIVPVGYDEQARGVVVGVDGSPASDAALEFAAVEAGHAGQTLHAVLAWQEPPVWMDAQVPGAEYLRSLEEMHSQILDDSLTGLTERHPGLHIDRRVVRGPAYKSLLEAAENAAMIVVGNHGLRGIKRFLLGSVSHSVIVGALCPIVVARSD